MTDVELVAKKLTVILACVHDLRTLGRPDALASDVREERFVEHTLQIAIQAALDAASHIVSERRLGEPRSNRDLFAALERDGWIAASLTTSLQAMAGFRNVLVHGYGEVDLGIVRDVVMHRLVDLEAFVDALRARLPADGG